MTAFAAEKPLKKLATTTGDFARYYKDDEDRIRAMHRAGFRFVDLSLYNMTNYDHPYMQNGWETRILRLGALAASLGMEFVQSHAPNCNPLCFDENWETQVAVTARALEICGLLGIPCSVFHTGWNMDIRYTVPGDRERYYEGNMTFIRRLIPIMERTGVMLLIENSTHANMGDRYYFYTGQDMKDFLSYAAHPLLGACWDTGHANIEGHQYADITALGDDLRAIHFNDNRGEHDEHIMPYMGTMSVDEVMCALRDIDFGGAFTFECDSSLRPAQYWLGNRRPWNETAADEADLATKEAMERALYLCGESILTRYGYSVRRG
ncbi:MAG: sugar phosphate isomerase/epimerase [Clostridia bacterium]|nr:sugar phosphate isomerase/epimerase [Clostridia bacterium]